jgi:multicomponent K+:H+ antiporter subunit C
MEFLVATAIAAMTASGIYLLLRARTYTVVLGLTLLTYAINLFVFCTGRLTMNRPPMIVDGQTDYADPLPQALVLTAIVISFGMTALLLVLAVRSYFESDGDHVDLVGPEEVVAQKR